MDKYKQYSGRLSRGENAVSIPVILRLRRSGIEIDSGLNVAATTASTPAVPAKPALETWSYDGLVSAVPVTKNSAEVLVHLADHPDVTLFVANRDFAAALTEAAPQLSAWKWRLGALKPGATITASVAAIAALLYVGDFSPSKTIASVLPEKARVQMGRRVVKNMTARYKTCSDKAGRKALDKMMTRLSDAAGLPKPYDVRVVNWHLVNAFAAPGGQLVLTKGLITKAKSPEMVAGVMAHEMGHGIELHPEAGLVRALGMSAAGEFFFTGSSSSLKNIGFILTTLSFSREAEREADNHAIRILRKAKISQKPLAQFFSDLSKRAKTSTIGRFMSNYPLLSTHPDSDSRAKILRQQAVYTTTPIFTDAEWQALKNICGKKAGPRSREEIAAAHKKTIETTTKTLKARPRDLKALKKRAAAYRGLKRYDEAIADTKAVIAIEPRKVLNHARLATLYHYKKDWAREIDAYSEAIKLQPKRYYYYTYRARARVKLKRYAGAREDYGSALKLRPKNAYLLGQRAALSVKMKDWDAAIADYDLALTLRPKESRYIVLKAQARRAKGDHAGALADIEKAIEIAPKSMRAYLERASIHLTLGLREDAIADYSKAITLSRRPISIHLKRGLLYEKLGDRKAAIADYRKVLKAKASRRSEKESQAKARERLAAMGEADKGNAGQAK